MENNIGKAITYIFMFIKQSITTQMYRMIVTFISIGRYRIDNINIEMLCTLTEYTDHICPSES